MPSADALRMAEQILHALLPLQEPSYPRGWSPALRRFIARAMLVDPCARPSAREAIDLLPGPRG